MLEGVCVCTRVVSCVPRCNSSKKIAKVEVGHRPTTATRACGFSPEDFIKLGLFNWLMFSV